MGDQASTPGEAPLGPEHAETLLEESDSADASESARCRAETLLDESDSADAGESARYRAETLLEESDSADASESARYRAETLLEESDSAEAAWSEAPSSESARSRAAHAETLADEQQHHAATLVESGPTETLAPERAYGAAPMAADEGETIAPPAEHDRTRAAPSQSDLGQIPDDDDDDDERFGAYRVERELARGGMGVVYLARDPRLGRQVAVKALLAGEFASELALERFQIEARAAARLRHPGIVGIHEIGVADGGRHYLVMDFIPGGSLADRIAKEGPYAPREAAEVVKTLAGAVAYAHARGVIHRDLKPANVLLDAAKRPVVTDFGLAKEAERLDGPTRSGQLMGTPAYMPPEQARGEVVDARADVYALGAILYECVTGRAPFVAPSLPKLLEKLEDEDPLPLTQRAPGTPLDLSTICAACLEKEPEARYASADALAADLARFLGDEPIQARPATLGQRAGKWFRRNAALAQAVGAVVAIALLFLGVGTALFVRRLREETQAAQEGREAAEQAARELAAAERVAARERDEAKRQRAAAESARDEAQREREAAEEARDEARRQTDNAEKSLQDLLDTLQATGQTFHLLSDVIGGELAEVQDVRVRRAREKVLAQLLRELERLDAHPRLSLGAGPLRARTYLEEADLLFARGEVERSLGSYQRAVAAAREAKSSDHLQQALVNQAIALEQSGDIAAATSASREALAVSRASLAEESTPSRRSALVAALLRVAEQASRAGRPADAKPLLEEALRVASSGDDPEDTRTQAGARFALGRWERSARNYAAAREHFRETVALARARAKEALRTKDRVLSHALRALASEERRAGQREAELALLEEGLSFARQRYAADSADAAALAEVVESLRVLAVSLASRGKSEEAARQLEDAQRLAQAHFEEHPSLAAGDTLGDVLLAWVSFEDARGATAAAAERSLASLKHARALAERWPRTERAQEQLLAALEGASQRVRKLGRSREGLDYAQEAVELQRGLLQAAPTSSNRRRNLAIVLERLGSAEVELGLPSGRQRLLESAALRRELLKAAPDAADTLLDLAVILDRIGDLAASSQDHATAHASHEEASEILRRLLAKDPQDRTQRTNLAIVLRKVGVHEQHDEDFARARELFEEVKGVVGGLLRERPSDGGVALELAVSLDRLAALDQAEGQLQRAAQGYQEAQRLYLALAKHNPRSLRLQQTAAAGYLRLAQIASELGQGEPALQAARLARQRQEALVAGTRGLVEVQRDLAVTLYRAGELHAKHGELSVADARLEAALAAAAPIASASHLAQECEALREEVGRVRERVRWLRGEGQPASGREWKALTKLLVARGERGEALRALERALDAGGPAPLASGEDRLEALKLAAELSCASAPPRLEEAKAYLTRWADAAASAEAEARAELEGEGADKGGADVHARRAERRLRRLKRARAALTRSTDLEPLRGSEAYRRATEG